jgi:lysophospholipid acyltransferase (LPLAT)-like uncharacterized protein
MSETDGSPENAGRRTAGQRDGPGEAASGEAQPRAAQQRGRSRRLWLRLFGLATSGLLRALGATWRIETIGHDPQRPGPGGPARLAALFHESMVPCAWLYRDRRYSVAVSRSRDGDLIRASLIALGYAEPARGSSSRGGSTVLRGLVRMLGAGTTVAVLVDGPRGPARVAKTGVIHLARLSGRPIQPVAFSARPALRLSSWDQSLLPLPFARVVVAYAEPMEVPSEPDLDDTQAQHLARRLEEQLVALHHAADGRLLGRRVAEPRG